VSVALIVASLATLAACSGSNDGPDASAKASTPAPAPSATATTTASSGPEAAQQAAVLETYRRFWDEQVKAYAKGDITGTNLIKYAGAEALSSTKDDLKDLRAKGIVTTGAPTHDTSVDQLLPYKKVPYARLTDCLDSSDWKFVYTKTRKPVEMPKNRLIRYITKVEAEKWGPQWRIVNVTPQQHAC
jgi:hypothetical protein